MKHFYNNSIYFILFFFLSLPNTVNASNFYFSTGSGDDTRSMEQAQNPATPWKTINKLNAIFSQLKPGDNIYFNRGEVFAGSILVAAQGLSGQPITFSAYGTGAKPIISGFATLQNWTSLGNGIWEAPCATEGSSVNMVTINDNAYAMGRFPNATASNKGYLTITSHSSNNQITGSGLSGNWLGGEVVIRMKRWIIDRSPITGQSGSTLTFTPTSSYTPENNYGFFIQNHAATLDAFGEWYFDKANKKLRVFFGTVSPNDYVVKASVRENGISFNGGNYIQVDNLSILGANSRGVNIDKTIGGKVTNCEIHFSGTDAIYGQSTGSFTLENSVITNSNNNGVSLYWQCPNTVVRNNKISTSGMMAGMGKSGDFTYSALSLNGASSLIENNEITNTGYNALHFGGGNNCIVKNNLVNQFNLVKDDGSGIYTWSNGTVYTGSKVFYNTVLNGLGAPAGTANPELALAEAIYLDDNSANIEVAFNTTNNTSKGLYIHNANNLNIHDNTFFNSRDHQVYMEHDYVSPQSPIRNVTFTNNILAAKEPKQELMTLRTKDNDIAQFGTFTNNYYTRTLGGSAVAVTTITGNYTTSQVNSEYNLARWKTTYGFEANSTENKPGAHYTINSLLGVNKFPNKTFDTNIEGIFGHPYPGPGSDYLKINWDNTKLDGGSLRAAVTGYNSMAYVGANVVGIEAGKKYLLRFSSLGANANRTLKVRIINKEAPYQTVTLNSFLSTTSRQEHEFLLEPSVSITNAVLRFEFFEPDGTIWLDNIALHEADLTVDNAHVRFDYNAAATTKAVSLGSITYIDGKNETKSGDIGLVPYASMVLMKQGSIVTQPIASEPVSVPPATANPGMVTVFPVPFNGSATFEFTLSQKSRVTITLYALDGTKVDDIIRGSKTFPTGKNSVLYKNYSLKNGTSYIYEVRTDQWVYKNQILVSY